MKRAPIFAPAPRRGRAWIRGPRRALSAREAIHPSWCTCPAHPRAILAPPRALSGVARWSLIFIAGFAFGLALTAALGAAGVGEGVQVMFGFPGAPRP